MRATLQSRNGACCHTTVYVIDGHLAEPLLGDEDAKALDILHIDAGGGTEHIDGSEALPDADVDTVAGIVHNLETAGVRVEATRSTSQNLSDRDRSRIQRIVKQHKKVFEGAGLLKDDIVSFRIDPEVPPVAAPYRPVPLAYQERLSAHLAELRSERKIEDVGPREECPILPMDLRGNHREERSWEDQDEHGHETTQQSHPKDAPTHHHSLGDAPHAGRRDRILGVGYDARVLPSGSCRRIENDGHLPHPRGTSRLQSVVLWSFTSIRHLP